MIHQLQRYGACTLCGLRRMVRRVAKRAWLCTDCQRFNQ